MLKCALMFDEVLAAPAKIEADYVERPVDGDNCAACQMFRAPDSCTKVPGAISPNGHCKYFARSASHPKNEIDVCEDTYGPDNNPALYSTMMQRGGAKPKSTTFAEIIAPETAHKRLNFNEILKDSPSVGDVHVPSALGGAVQPPKARRNKKPKKTPQFSAFIGDVAPHMKPNVSITSKVYSSTADLPDAVKNKLKGKKLRQWREVFNSSMARHGKESRAFAEAWSTVKKRAFTEDQLDIIGSQELTDIEKSLDALNAQPMVGVGGRNLQPFDDGTYFVPFPYDPAALGYLRVDQVPRFLDALTHPKDIEKRDMPINDLIAVKGRIGRDVVNKHLDKLAQKGKLRRPVVVRMNGGNYIADGHDRLGAYYLNGDDIIPVRYSDIESYDQSKPDPAIEHRGSRFELLQGAKGRRLANFKGPLEGTTSTNTLAIPFRYDPTFFTYLRPDQIPKFLSAVTHPEDQPETELPLQELVAIQDRVNADTIAHFRELGYDDLPIIVKLEGNMYYIADGHDRLSAAWLGGADTAKVRLKDLSGLGDNTMKATLGTFKITKINEEKQQIFGWASVVTKNGVIVTDKQSDQIEPHELEKAAYDYVLHSRNMGHMHQKMNVGKMIESCVFTTEKQKAMGIALPDNMEAWWVGFAVEDQPTWACIKNGDREFSIGGYSQQIPLD